MISHHIHTFECDIPTDTQHNFENIDSLSNGTDNSKHKLGLKFIVIFLSNSKKINYYYYYYPPYLDGSGVLILGGAW